MRKHLDRTRDNIIRRKASLYETAESQADLSRFSPPERKDMFERKGTLERMGTLERQDTFDEDKKKREELKRSNQQRLHLLKALNE